MFKSESFHIYIVGCGGNGSRLLDKIGNYVVSQRRTIPITLIDEDVVERKNIERQRFHMRDIGQPKAKVLADKFSVECGYSCYIDYWNTYINDDKLPHRMTSYFIPIVILCVDNNPTRKIFWEFFRGLPNEETVRRDDMCDWVLIDMGNGTTFGQCTSMVHYKGQLYGSDPRLLYPNMQDLSVGNMPVAGGTCATGHISEPQTLAANERTSQFGYDVFYELVHNGRLLPRCEWAFMHDVGDGNLVTGMDIDLPIEIGS